MTAIVLAGGRKTLINELYPETPASLITLAEQPFLYWLTQWIKMQGFLQIVYSAGQHFEKISAWVHQQATLDSDVLFDVLGEVRPLGTGGATLLAAKRFPAELFLVVNGDTLVLTQLQSAIKELKNSSNLDGVIVGTNVNNAGRFGSLVIDSNQHLVKFREKQPSKGLVNAGIYLLKQSLLEDVEVDKELSLEYECFPKWLNQGKKFKVIYSESPFMDISTPETLAKAQTTIQLYCSSLESASIE